MPDNYVAYHLHSDLSLLDSCTKFGDYVDYAVQNGQHAIAFTEHGNILNWVHKKMYCDTMGIKYLHGVECYLTENPRDKVRDNYHTVLIAKNYDGVLELNSLVSRSYEEDHFYYKPRISFDEFVRISPNIIKISACLASPLNKLQLDNAWYDKLARAYDYYEVQPHLCADQVLYNQHLAQLSHQYHKPLIAGTDTHSINKYKAECRSILQKAKHIAYTDEDAFDLTYKTYDELWDIFRRQEALPDNLIAEAISNTNAMADMVEDFTLDTAFKYPILYGSHQRDAEEYDKQVQQYFEDKVQSGIIPAEQVQAFREAIEEEGRVFDKVDMKGYMLFVGELVRWCKSHDIPLGPSRGSVGGSRVAYVLDITDLNSEQWHTVFSRFCNEDRKELGDVDLDLPPDSRERVYQHIFDQFGSDYTSYILAIGTISSKGTIDEIGRALSLRWDENKNRGTNPYTLACIDKIKREFEADENKARQAYPELFYYYDGLLNTAVSQSMHPAGVIVSPVTLPDGYGTLRREGKIVLQIDMEAVHEVNLVKYDLLGLANVQILRDTYRLLGQPYPRTCEIDWDDQAVWKDMLRSPVGIFQMESAFAFQALRQFKPTSIFEMSLVTAAIRPSGASYRNDLLARKTHTNPSPIIDELLKNNLNFLVYQEDTIKFLQQICGLSGSEADNVRRAIGRKQEDRLQAALPRILEGYCAKSSQPREIAEQEAKEFLQIIEDSASYQFGYNHSIGYCLIGYMCAYLRYYHPYEFITAYLNNAKNEEDTVNGSTLAQEYGINITPPKFGVSKDAYVADADKRIIAKGVTSIKYMNKQIADELYQLAHTHTFDTFTDLLYAINQHTSVDSRQLDILIRVEFFSEFGNPATLLQINETFRRLKNGTAKTMRKDQAEDLSALLPRFATDVNAKGQPLKNWTITDCMGLIRACEAHIRALNLPDMTLQERAKTQLELLGCINLTTGKEADRRKVFITDLTPLKSKDSGSIWAYKVGIKSVGSGKNAVVTVRSKVYNSTPFKRGDILYASSLVKDNRGYWYLQDYERC